MADGQLYEESGNVIRAATAELLEGGKSLEETAEQYASLCGLIRRLHLNAAYEDVGRGAVKTEAVPALARLAVVCESDLLHSEAVHAIGSLCTNPVCQPSAFQNPDDWKQLFKKSLEMSGIPFAVIRLIGNMGKTASGARVVLDAGGLDLLVRVAVRHQAVIADACLAITDIASCVGVTTACQKKVLESGVSLCLDVVVGAGKFVSELACNGLTALLECGMRLRPSQWLQLNKGLKSELMEINWGSDGQTTPQYRLFEALINSRPPGERPDRQLVGIIHAVATGLQQCIETGELSASEEEHLGSLMGELREAVGESNADAFDAEMARVSDQAKAQEPVLTRCASFAGGPEILVRKKSVMPPSPPALLEVTEPHSAEYIQALRTKTDCNTVSWGAVIHRKTDAPHPEPLQWGAAQDIAANQAAHEKRWTDRPRSKKTQVFNRPFTIKHPLGKDKHEKPPHNPNSRPGKNDKPPLGELVFESRFESGNLSKAVQVNEFEYDLTMSTDTNSTAITQWFYFRFSNNLPKKAYTFNIINFDKPASLFNKGQRPLIYQEGPKSKGWLRCGEDICYYKRDDKFKTPGQKIQYILSFTFTLEKSGTYYLAPAFPYTMLDLRTDICHWLSDPARGPLMRHDVLGVTQGGVEQDLLIIEQPGSAHTVDTPVIVLSARVHPGETNSSYVMRGLVEYLSDPLEPSAQKLRTHYRIIIIPMLNPDGVVLGNYRCAMAGLDMNREWKRANLKTTPPVFHLKKLMKSHNNVVLYCDLHGHSRMLDACMYGNKVDEFGASRAALFPYLMSTLSPSFSFRRSTFRMGKSKAGTGRVVAYREIGILDSFTLETSLAGQSKNGEHYKMSDLEQMGRHVGATIWEWHQALSDEATLDAYCKRISRLILGLDQADSSDDDDPWSRNEANDEDGSEHDGEEELWSGSDDESQRPPCQRQAIGMESHRGHEVQHKGLDMPALPGLPLCPDVPGLQPAIPEQSPSNGKDPDYPSLTRESSMASTVSVGSEGASDPDRRSERAERRRIRMEKRQVRFGGADMSQEPSPPPARTGKKCNGADFRNNAAASSQRGLAPSPLLLMPSSDDEQEEEPVAEPPPPPMMRPTAVIPHDPDDWRSPRTTIPSHLSQNSNAPQFEASGISHPLNSHRSGASESKYAALLEGKPTIQSKPAGPSKYAALLESRTPSFNEDKPAPSKYAALLEGKSSMVSLQGKSAGTRKYTALLDNAAGVPILEGKSAISSGESKPAATSEALLERRSSNSEIKPEAGSKVESRRSSIDRANERAVMSMNSVQVSIRPQYAARAQVPLVARAPIGNSTQDSPIPNVRRPPNMRKTGSDLREKETDWRPHPPHPPHGSQRRGIGYPEPTFHKSGALTERQRPAPAPPSTQFQSQQTGVSEGALSQPVVRTTASRGLGAMRGRHFTSTRSTVAWNAAKKRPVDVDDWGQFGV